MIKSISSPVLVIPANTVSPAQSKAAPKIVFVEQRKPSLLEQAKQYAKEHPYRAAGMAATALTATAATTSLLYVGAKAAWNTNYMLIQADNLWQNLRNGPIIRPATMGERAAAAQSAMGEAVKTATAPVTAAAATAYAATASAAQSAADATASAYNTATESVANGYNAAASAVKSAAHSTYNTVTYPFVASYNAAASAAQSAANATASAYNTAKDSAVNGYNTVASAANSAKDSIASGYNVAKDSAVNGYNAVASAANSAKDSIASGAQSVYNSLPSTSDIRSAAYSTYETGKGAVVSVYETAKEVAQVTKEISSHYVKKTANKVQDFWFGERPVLEHCVKLVDRGDHSVIGENLCPRPGFRDYRFPEVGEAIALRKALGK